MISMADPRVSEDFEAERGARADRVILTVRSSQNPKPFLK